MRNCHPAPVVLATALFAVSSVFGANYAKYATITVPGVPDNTTLTDFPLLVKISASAPSGFSYGDFMQNDYSDLRFEDANENGLPYDVDTWNTAGESLVWVKVPALVKNSEITMRWGSADPDANDPTTVWSNYIGVWHFNDTASSASATYPASAIKDRGDTTFAVSNSEMAHLGMTFFNSNANDNTRFKLGTTANNPLSALTSISQFSVSMWLKSTNLSPSYRLFSNKSAYSDSGFEFLAYAGSDQGLLLRGNDTSPQVGWWGAGMDPVKTGGWTHLAAKIDGTSGTLFSNGTSYNGSIAAPSASGNYGVAVGGYANNANAANPIRGHVDEVRLYNGVPSDAYLVAEWEQIVTAGYTVIGAAQTADAGAADIPAAPAVVRNQNGTYTISATFTGTAGETYAYAFQLNGTDRETGSATLGAAETEKTISWTTDGNVANGTYLASVTVTKGTSTALRSAATTFLVGDVGFGTGVNAVEEGLVPGAFVLTRPGDASQPLTVAYSVSSATATAGTSYEAIPGSATFAAGDTTVSIPVVPLNDPALTADATITLTLSAGLYDIAQGSESTAITLVNWAPPAGYNVWVAGSGSDGLASTAANWSAGRAPIATDAILLGAWSSANMTWDAAATHTVASWTQNADYPGTVTFPITYEGADVDAGFNLFTVTGDVELQGGKWTHPVQGNSSNSEIEPAERYWLNVTVGGDFAVSSGVQVSAEGCGRGFWTGGGYHNRGIHAGYVTTMTNETHDAVTIPLLRAFGSILEPMATGKGATRGTDGPVAYGHGGGALHIVVRGTFSNAGKVIANGQLSSESAGGSGGSIYIRAAAIAGAGTFEVNATAPRGSGQQAAGSGGRVALVTTGSNAATATTATACGSRSPDQWQWAGANGDTQPYWEGAAGTVWLQSGTSKSLVVRNVLSWHAEAGSHIRAYTPIPADDDTAAFASATANAELYAASNARIRLEGNLKFASLKVRTESDTLAHVDLFGNTLRVDSVVDTGDNVILSASGTYTLADAVTNGWTWFEDSVGTGKLVIGEQATLVLFR